MTARTATAIGSRSALAHLLMLAVVAIWGMTFVVVKDALRDIAPQTFNALRMALAFAVLAVVYRGQWRSLTRQAWLAGAVAGACLATGYFFQTAGLVYTTPTNSAFLTGLVVVLVPFLATLPGLRAPGSEIPGWNAWLGALLAFAGVALLTTPAHSNWTRMLLRMNRGDALTLGCALGFAMHVIVLSRVTRHVPFRQVAMLQIGFAMAFLALSAAATQPFGSPSGVTRWSGALLAALLVTGVLATAVAFSVQTWAQQILPPANIAVILALEPVFAWLTAFLLLQERLQLRRAAGATLVLSGILSTELLQRWRGRTAAHPDPETPRAGPIATR